MCGIVGYVGINPKSNQVLLDGLKSLEYRGYDSAGMASIVNGEVRVIKTRGKVANLEKKIQDLHVPSSVLGIAHTRWATHGIPNQSNAHPHHHGKVTLVHNGIIENYGELKEVLLKQGYVFESETDTEIAAAYIDYVYAKGLDKLATLQEANRAFRGSFAFGIIFLDEQDTLYAMRRNSPLIVAVGENENYIASDVPAILKYTKQYILLDQDEIAVLRKDEIQVYTLDLDVVDYEIKTATMDASAIAKDGYEHFMLKEIHEEPRVVRETMFSYVQDDIDQLVTSLPDLSKYQQIHIVSCGSAMYAGMIAKSLIESAARVRVDVEIASEYRYKDPIYDVNTLVLVVSQSGETADSLAALLLAKQQGVDTMAIVNVVGSSIAREAKYVAYTHAGVEIAVATTKAYCTQVALLSLVALNLTYVHGKVSKTQANEIIKEIQQLPDMLQHMIDDVQYVKAAKIISRHNNVFFIGRGLDYALCMEGSLKLKEISYIHSEAYAAGELKHGTISLIEKGTPVVAICTEERLYEKTISNIKEVKARGANVILVVREDLQVAQDYYDYKISIPKVNRLIQGIVGVVPLQLLSYQVANLRGCEIDQPRNLAKSVTVE
ncbi:MULTISPECIES: glutamine--fructose-6-phosphate transaminase (isomerizing) [unclassified Breznakia]|uniref:glutamine--fructose-6-phosphate transaminase (isomerizing) n=1 Tax=unclassified Breznakia TaxID=2623764 RepID=UPI0024741A84|nr:MULTISPECIES: glutamine--fructose-6-phosphate transaminase (isomerizing) [unclassified Breznakia]MDH6367822.1 glucosamine--fructose-6-phosphate aminotransferase (isomerizing) [Breznakia sp. PH1-1]MDH6404931.1 glucosamine--fructose-6-phosphate aminotransferase (isomerizing) [Breznakia sp. PF1-11]MDH6412625.1 glucosamine--fructose-6-phosphate aminotransferase (isomerizing) [Breznakia sp. PFB1-11]MDH6415006.1 glucosamine--fructose-6-phosphate aminotransferase (isomerizing) [Breznakia sp. PFB1-1